MIKKLLTVIIKRRIYAHYEKFEDEKICRIHIYIIHIIYNVIYMIIFNR